MSRGGRRIYGMAAACVAVLAASVLVPRMIRDTGGGFAAATTAAVLFLGLATVAAVASLALLVHTLRQRDALSLAERLAGLIPAALVVFGLVGFWLSINNKS